jgi:hypothetical protein
MTKSDAFQEQLSQLFGSYKAEWLKEQIHDLFTQPSYFPELTTTRSCILIGGRGTGKTTVLRGMSYPGQFVLSGNKPEAVSDWNWFGLYYRVNTNHVTAFSGPELEQGEWVTLFAHYFNMLLCDLILEFLGWYELKTDREVAIAARDCERLATSLHLPACRVHRELRHALDASRISFEAYINNVVDASRPLLSLQASPVDLLAEAVLSLPEFQGKQFFFLLDEYENFFDYQQQVVNTLIKHSEGRYCFKIGVRELGWRCRSTLNTNEQLVHPADYARVHIVEKLQGEAFRRFAREVCQKRISKITLPDQAVIREVEQLLPGLSEEEEAIKLGVEPLAKSVLSKVERESGHAYDVTLQAMHALEVYFVGYWSESQSASTSEVLTEAEADPSAWKTRYGNYRHSILYTLRRGKRGIRKYYCGWDTFTQIAAGNIRYVLELVDQSLLAHFQERGSLETPVTPETQTKVAQRVGQMNLSELEGLSVDGAHLTKLLLSLGRVFQVMASDALGHTPEVNQFHLSTVPEDLDEDPALEEAERILNAAVMHLALLRTPGNKPGDVGDTKDYDYAVHAIFSALFEFSPRRKRKMSLSTEDLLGLIRRPRETIRAILKDQKRQQTEAIPEQLTLFERFYDANP